VAQDYGRKDDADFRQSAVNQLADLTIFQSEYSRFASREKYKVIAQDGPVIHNPVDISLFTPDAPRQKLTGSRKIACVSWSTNPQKGSTQIYSVAAQNSEFDFFLCGNFPNPPALANIHLQGVLGRTELARLLRSCDLLLTFSKNEACPNHVLEALASGLPVLYDDSGAMQEIIGESGLSVTPENFSTQAKQVYSQLAVFSERARNRATSLFEPNKIFTKYLDRIERALYEPTTLSPIRRQWMAWSALVPR
jgi:glycosyltransferase involved in cell wall biosynthesis